MASESAELIRIGTAILALVPASMRTDWVAYIAGNLDQNEGETDAEFIGRWFVNEQVLNPLQNADRQAAEVPPRDWSLTP